MSHRASLSRCLLLLAPLCTGPSGCGGTDEGTPADLALAPAASDASMPLRPPPAGAFDPFVRGVVMSGGKPLGGVRLRIQGQTDLDGPRYVESGADGTFLLPLPGRAAPDKPVVAAGLEGYVTALVPLPPDGQLAQVELRPLDTDTPAYPFVSATTGNAACGPCHKTQLDAWSQSMHAKAAADPLFLDENRLHLAWWQRLDAEKDSDAAIYAGPFRGRNDKGDSGKIFSESATSYRVVGDESEPGDCVRCHMPAYGFAGGVDPRSVALAGKNPAFGEGITCDVCHKVKNVRAVEEKDLIAVGLSKAELARPAAGATTVLGPHDDVTARSMPSSPARVFASSDFCAACHSDGRTVYAQPLDKNGNDAGEVTTRIVWGEDTFREWRFNPGTVVALTPIGHGITYSASGTGPFASGKNYAGRPLACQDCHMQDPPPDPQTGERIADYRAPDSGDGLIATHEEAVARDPRSVHPHRLEGRTARFVAWAVETSIRGSRDGNVISATVRVDNRHTGHAFPTGLPDRNVILLVDAYDDDGPLPVVDGPTVPGWGSGDGVTDPARDLGGKPGRGYARVLYDADGRGPVFYLRAVNVPYAGDTRLKVGDVDENTWRFTSRGKPARVRARVLHRLRFKAQTDAFLSRRPGADPKSFETPGDVVEATVF